MESAGAPGILLAPHFHMDTSLRNRSALRDRTRPYSARAGYWLTAIVGLAAGALLFTACDSPACVFGGDCNGTGVGGGAVGDGLASAPANGEWISNATPVITRFAPTGNLADTRTPIVFVFNESVSATGLNQAFELATDQGFPPLLGGAQVIGDGRVVCLFPITELAADTPYEIRYKADATILDRTGQKVQIPASNVIGTFRTAAANATAPAVLLTYPAGTAESQAATTEIVVAFNRPMLATSVTDASFAVTVDGVAPLPDPVARPLTQLGGGSETRVWRYRNADAQGEAVPLGDPSSVVLVTLSPVGSPIRDVANTILSTITFQFELASFTAPAAVAITSNPDDAIGIAQISGPADLAIEVALTGSLSGDVLQVFLFGVDPADAQNPTEIALVREVVLDQVFASFTLTAADINLLASSSPVRARFLDGPVAFAFQLRRGAVTSPVVRLDVDSLTDGIQDPTLDMLAPTLLGLSTAGNVTAAFRSDLRDLVIVGRASEALRSALVTTTASEDNLTPGGENPPRVSGSNPTGLFVAAPVPLGVLAQNATRTYSVTVYDEALNASGIAQGTFDQLGASVLGNPLPGAAVSVDVFDATTLAAIAGARVLTHENVGGVVTAVPGGSVLTDSAGHALVPAGPTGETILTVDGSAIGYGLFTFDALPTDQIDVPLQLTVLPAANGQGTINATDEDIDLYTLAVGDSRVAEIGESLFDAGPCAVDPFGFGVLCPFASFAIRPRQIGALSALAVDIPPNPFVYSPLTFLKGFGLTIPVPPTATGATDNSDVVVPFLLEGGGVDSEEFGVDVPEQDFDSSGYPFDPLFDAPRVVVESRSPGVPGPVTIGRGVAFDNGPGNWIIRAAYPGAADGIQDFPADQLGRLVTEGTIDADHFLCIEVVDDGGNRGATRTRLSNLGAAPSPLVPPLQPALAGTILNSSNECFNMNVTDVLPDAYQMPGIYRVTLSDGSGLKWTLFKADPPDAGGGVAILHVPYIGTVDPLPFPPGTIDFQGSAYAWESLDLSSFLWTDIERECEVYAHTSASSFTPPTP